MYKKEVLRELARQVSEISRKSIQNERRELWRRHNSLKRTRPPVIIAMGWWDVMATEIIPDSILKCEDPLLGACPSNPK